MERACEPVSIFPRWQDHNSRNEFPRQRPNPAENRYTDQSFWLTESELSTWNICWRQTCGTESNRGRNLIPFLSLARGTFLIVLQWPDLLQRRESKRSVLAKGGNEFTLIVRWFGRQVRLDLVTFRGRTEKDWALMEQLFARDTWPIGKAVE